MQDLIRTIPGILNDYVLSEHSWLSSNESPTKELKELLYPVSTLYRPSMSFSKNVDSVIMSNGGACHIIMMVNL